MTDTHVIVGAGQAGGWAALTMREAGFAGRIVLVGEEPWRPYERPPLSKTMLTEEPEPPVPYFHAAERYAQAGVELLLGIRAVAVDAAARRVRLSDGRVLPFDKLLLTTGGRARQLAVPGGETALTLRTLEDAQRIRARLTASRGRVVCIGAGVIGLETASSAHARGWSVTVLEATAAPLGRCVSPEGARFVAGLHAAAGVALHVGMAVAAISSEGVACADGRVFPADLVLAGVGMERDLSLAQAAGLDCDGGIVVDEFGQTSVAGIYAAGDIAALAHPLYGRRIRLESWRHAQNHGIAVARAMCGGVAPYDEVPWFWTDQHGVNLQVAGLPADAARTVVRVDQPRAFVAVHLAADDSVVGVTAAGAPRDIRAGTALIRAGHPVDAAALADPAVPLAALLRR